MELVKKQSCFYIFSPVGLLKICVREDKLLSIFKVQNKKKIKNSKLSHFEKSIKAQLKSYFQGHLKTFDIPIEFEKGTENEKRIWRALAAIPYGKKITYGDFALKMNLFQGARFIGRCCAKNPCLIVIPCHRVISKKGLGGFALGLKAKKRLLFIEKIK